MKKAIKLRAGREEDLPRLKELWEESFPGGLRFEELAESCFVPDEVRSSLVLLEDDIIESMVLFAPTFWYGGDRYAPMPYLIGVASDAAHRNRRYGSWVVETACDFMVEKGAGGVWSVLPDEKHELFFMSQGFWDIRGREGFSVRAGELPDTDEVLCRVEPEEYEALREEALRGKNHVVAGAVLTALQRDLAEHRHGGMFAGRIGGNPVCILTARYGSKAEIAEFLCPEGEERKALSMLKKTLPTDEYTVRKLPLGLLRQMNECAKMERPDGYLGCGLWI